MYSIMTEAVIEKYQIKRIIRRMLINSNNDVLIADDIISYMGGKCQICYKFRIILKTKHIFKEKQNICTSCYTSKQDHFLVNW